MRLYMSCVETSGISSRRQRRLATFASPTNAQKCCFSYHLHLPIHSEAWNHSLATYMYHTNNFVSFIGVSPLETWNWLDFYFICPLPPAFGVQRRVNHLFDLLGYLYRYIVGKKHEKQLENNLNLFRLSRKTVRHITCLLLAGVSKSAL